jgi:arsenate reductase (thioredoxin)
MHALDPGRFFPTLRAYVNARLDESGEIEGERREVLVRLAERVVEDDREDRATDVIFICTHNSRRSHFGQVWAQVAAIGFGFDRVRAHSGGSEATAFDARAVAALERAGLQIRRGVGAVNPEYTVKMGEASSGVPEATCFSKRFDHAANPRERFVAVMTCAQADTECPLVPGASARIALFYDDPKSADGTPQEAEVYDERCAQIARELLFAFEMAALSRDRTAGLPPAAGHDPAR